ncbi:MAG: hypothetical protein Q8M83_01185 [bacterium]|nr:hypothetical protein [bacterium]
MKLETTLLKTITKKQVYKNSFSDLVATFEKKLLDFNPVAKAFEIEKYFLNSGQVTVTKKLISDNIVSKDWLREYTTKKGKKKIDFKGLYIFMHDKTPIYVGISKGVIGRTLQHVKGHSHNTSTLAYNIGLVRYEIMKGEKYIGGRKEFDFKADVTPAKDFLIKQKIAFLPIDNDEELYLFEIYCAMQLQCWLNKFETH